MLARLLTDHDHIRKMLNLLEIQFLDLCRDKTRDYSIMQSVVVYIQEYAEQAHHPLEDAIFSILIDRIDDVKLTRELITDHTEMEVITRKLRASLESLKGGIIAGEELKNQLSLFLSRQRRHIYAEEMKVYPLVSRVLTKQDWKSMQSIVPFMDDPVFGELIRDDYKHVYQKIERQHQQKL